ncbi:hypothetical protein QUC31_019668 [Theobroma cacao]
MLPSSNLNGKVKVGVGFVVRNNHGEVMLAGLNTYKQKVSIVEAKIKALSWALSISDQQQLRIDEVEIDCMQLVKWLNDKCSSRRLGHSGKLPHVVGEDSVYTSFGDEKDFNQALLACKGNEPNGMSGFEANRNQKQS